VDLSREKGGKSKVATLLKEEKEKEGQESKGDRQIGGTTLKRRVSAEI